jgi:hypothetical protein
MVKRWTRVRMPARNEAARDAHEALSKRGYLPLRLSWPTYLVIRPQLPPVALEVLRSPNARIRPERAAALRALIEAGVESWLYTPGRGFTQLTPDLLQGVELLTPKNQGEGKEGGTTGGVSSG